MRKKSLGMHSESPLLLFFLLTMLFVSDVEPEKLEHRQIEDPLPATMVSVQRQTVPVVNPTTGPTTTTPSGRAWCIASANASPTALQVALDYACGYSGADCSAIQPSGPCYDPNTVHDHASYAFNSYYQRNPIPTSCVFGGTAQLSNTDPSYGNCRYAASTTTNPTPNPPVMPMPPPSTTTNPYTPTTNPAPGGTTNPAPGVTTNPYAPGGNGGSEPTGYDYGNEPPSSVQSVSFSLMLISLSYLILTAFAAHEF